MQVQKFASPLFSGAVAPALLRVRALSRCKPLFGRSGLRIRVRRRSLGNPSGFHRRRELRTTLWRQIEFSLHFFGCVCFISPGGRFPFFLSHADCRCRFKFLFQLGELLRTLLQASFQPPDFLTKILRLHMGSMLLPPVTDATSVGYRVNDKTFECHVILQRHRDRPAPLLPQTRKMIPIDACPALFEV